MNSISQSLLLLLLLVLGVAVQATSTTPITVTGPLVDLYCWDTLGGIALDTREQLRDDPYRHTVHCLIDVGVCVRSGYAMVHKPDGASQWQVLYYLDDEGNRRAQQELLPLPKGQRGFDFTITGVPGPNQVLLTSTGETSPPPGSPTMPGAPTMPPGNTGGGGEDGSSNTGGGGDPSELTFEVPGAVVAHCVLAGLAFGLCFPLATLMPLFLSRFLLPHVALNVIGLTLGVIAIIVISAYKQGVITLTTHGQLGVALIVLVAFQVLMGVARPHKPASEKEAKSSLRTLFEWVHPSLGRIILICTAAQLYYGYTLLNDLYLESDPALDVWKYIHVIGFSVIYFLFVGAWKVTAEPRASNGPGNTSTDHSDSLNGMCKSENEPGNSFQMSTV